MRQQYQHYLWQNIRPNLEIIQLLERLQKTYKMAIISNGSHSNQQRKIHKAKLKPYFQQITISGKMGVRKPCPDIFTQTLKRLDRKPEESLFIGDSLKNDIQGAASVGMKSCWVSTHTLPRDPQLTPDYHINSITELESILPQ